MSELSIGIITNPDEDIVRLQFDNAGDENSQHRLAQYLHPRLLGVIRHSPRTMEVNVHINPLSTELLVDFLPVGDWHQRQDFEKFLYKWLPKALEEYTE
jgi:hypothetical protein